MGERGVGGSKCGATCALALVLEVSYVVHATHLLPLQQSWCSEALPNIQQCSADSLTAHCPRGHGLPR